MDNVYGQTKSEKLAEESRVAREIVREIGHFGINDRQRMLVIYYLSLELENTEDMKSVSSFVRDLKGESLFLTKIYGAEEEGV